MPDPTIRKRSLPQFYKGEYVLIMDGVTYFTNRGEWDASGTQRTVSEGHNVSLLGETDQDIGGDFHSYKSEIVHVSHPRAQIRQQGWIQKNYTGSLGPAGARTLREDEVDLSSIQTLNAFGATAIARTSPVDSRAEALTSISESLKDGLPAIAGVSTWRDRSKLTRGAGSEYLNAQFGWVPLISDVKKVADSYKNSAKILAQLKRDAGRNVRRRYVFPIESDTTVVKDFTENAGAQLVGSASLDGSYWSNHSGRYTHIRETTRKRWFSGAFTYHMPSTETQMGKVMNAYQMYDHLYGIALTPDVLWNLTPWSWATDWFANTGDVMSNVSNAMLYGQILRYGYIMEKTTIIDRYSVLAEGFTLGPGPYSVVVKTTVKRRIRANPFGFGITFDGLDAYQLSILAALGMTRR